MKILVTSRSNSQTARFFTIERCAAPRPTVIVVRGPVAPTMAPGVWWRQPARQVSVAAVGEVLLRLHTSFHHHFLLFFAGVDSSDDSSDGVWTPSRLRRVRACQLHSRTQYDNQSFIHYPNTHCDKTLKKTIQSTVKTVSNTVPESK